MSTLQILERKFKQADAALAKKDPKKAEKLLRELVASEPDEPLFHWKLGYALSESQQYAKAIPEFKKALKLDPENIAAVGCLGRAYVELGKWKEAEITLRKRLELEENPPYYVFLAHVLMQTDRFDEAIDTCRKALDLDPQFAEAYLNIGLAYRRKRKMDEAIEAFRNAIIFDSKYSLAYRELGLTYFARGEFVAAGAALEECLKLDKDDAWGHLYLALCLQHMRDDRKAGIHFAKAAQLGPDIAFIQEKHKEFINSIRHSKD